MAYAIYVVGNKYLKAMETDCQCQFVKPHYQSQNPYMKNLLLVTLKYWVLKMP